MSQVVWIGCWLPHYKTSNGGGRLMAPLATLNQPSRHIENQKIKKKEKK